MAIPVMNFSPVQVPNQPDPLLTGLTTGLQVYTQLLNAFAQPGQMAQKQAMSQADLEKTQAQTQLTQAQIDKLNQPQSYNYQSSMGKMVSDYQQIVKAYGADSEQAKQAKSIIDAQLAQQEAKAASSNAYASGFGEMLAPKSVREQRISDYMKQGYSQDQAVQLAADQKKSGQISPIGVTPQSQMRSDQLESEISKNTMPVDVQKRQYASERTEVALQSLDQFVDQGALNYTGTAGKAKLQKDKLTASLTGKVSPQLEAYMNFDSQLASAKNDVATTLAVPADQLSRGELGYLFDYSKYSSNPEVAKRQYQNTKNLIRNTENINFKNLTEVAKLNKELGESVDKDKSDNLKVNPDAIKEAPSDAKKALGVKEVNIPSFNSKQEFQQWYSKQSPAVQAAVKQKLGGQ